MSLGENIYRLRSGRNMSQLELAERLGVSRQSVSKWELGAATPELDKLAAMSELFGVTLDALVYGGETAREAPAPDECPAHGSRRSARFVVGTVLLCCGVIFFVLLFGFGANGANILDALLAPAIYCSPLWAPGLACILAEKRAGFWIAAAVYASLCLITELQTSVMFSEFLRLFSGHVSARGIIFAALGALDIAVAALGIRAFRGVRIVPGFKACAVLLALTAFTVFPLSLLGNALNVMSLARTLIAAKHFSFSALIIYASIAAKSVFGTK